MTSKESKNPKPKAKAKIIAYYDWYKVAEYICDKYEDVSYDDLENYRIELHDINSAGNGVMAKVDDYYFKFEENENNRRVIKHILDEFSKEENRKVMVKIEW